jgi:beta-galactosidase
MVFPSEKKFLINGEPTFTGLDAGMFQDTNTRIKIDLSGKWLAKIENKWIEVQVPSAYDFTGNVTFRKNFNLSDSILNNMALFLVSYGINYECEIFINGQFLSRHIGGYTSFVVKIPDRMLNFGDNVIEIRVSNKLNSRTTIPLRHQVWAWRNYGGIFRDIYILATPKVWIDDAKVKYTFGSNYAVLNGEIELYVSSVEISKIFRDKNFELKLQIFERENNTFVAETTPVKFFLDDSRSQKINLPFTVYNPRLWSPESPSLYILKLILTNLGNVVDEFIILTGFRDVKISNGDIYLNGKRFILKGISRHEDHPKYGNSLTYEEMEKDIVLIKNLGANAIRLGHYPAHPYVLNLCDRYGLFVLEEIPVWNVPADILTEERYISLAKDYVYEMINRDKNHPSVFAWGIGNEFDSAEPIARRYVEELRKFIRAIDDRPVYYVSRMIKNDVCADLVDIACVNVYVDDLRKFSENILFWKSKYKNKPVVISEYGKAVQLGNRNGYSDPLSYESQAKYILERYRLIQEFDFDGSFVWIFADWKGERPVLTLPNSDHYLYTMGLVSYDRSEKRPAYEVLKALYTEGKIPALPIGDYSEPIPTVYTIIGIILLLSLSYIYYSYRWFRENLNRALFKPYNFFVDVRDQYLISIGQTTILSLILSSTFGIFIAGVLNRLKQNEYLDYILTHFIFVDQLKVRLISIIWDPLYSSIFFSILSFVSILFIALLIQFFSTFVKVKVYPSHSYSVAVWSFLPLIFLIPIDMILYRVISGFGSGLVIVLIGVFVCLISFVRLVKGIAIIYEVKQLRVGVVSVALILVVLSFMLLYYNYEFSSFAYLKFFLNILNSTK